jgi:shikimate dehydrogenase
MHNKAFAVRGLDWHYMALAVPPESLEADVTRWIDEVGYRGFNVTIPHKQAILKHPRLAEISPAVQSMGAANTLIVRPDGTLKADNTDWMGFLNDLKMLHIDPAGKNCLILGSGGASRAIVYALRQKSAAEITIATIEDISGPGIITYDQLPRYASRADLIIHCTPLGMSPDVNSTVWPEDLPFPPGAILYDLVYNPAVTRLMMIAREAGASAYSGLGMLVWQGALSFEAWTGMAPPVDMMFAAAKNALYGKEERV